MQTIWNVPLEDGQHPADHHLNKKKLIRRAGRPMKYQIRLNQTDPEDRATFGKLLTAGAINVLGYRPEALVGFLPGMTSPAAEEAFAAIKKAAKDRAKAEKAAVEAQKASTTADALVRQGNDPKQFATLNKERLKAKEKAESSVLFLDTVKRHLEQKWRDFFTTLQAFQKEQVDNLIGEIAPKAEDFRTQIRALFKAWNKETAPLLEKLSQVDQRYPSTVYFEQLTLGDLQLRELKSLRAFPTVQYIEPSKADAQKGAAGRFSFQLEVIA